MTDNITKYKKDILQKIRDDHIEAKSFHELEVKFKDINHQDYLNLMKRLDTLKLLRTSTMSNDYTINKNRISSSTIRGANNAILYNIVKMSKRRIYDELVEEYGFKISLSEEKTLKSEIVADDASYESSSTHTRIKERTSYSTGTIRFDLTKVKTIGSTRIGVDSYEIEVEVISTIDDNSMDELEKCTYYVIKSLQEESVNIYTHIERENLIHLYNKVLDAPETNTLKHNKPILSHFIMSNARNLRLTDCRNGYIHSEEKGSFEYTFTHKADGIRRLMVFDLIGIWLVYAPYTFNLLFRYEQFTGATLSYLKSFIGTIFDGEEIRNDSRHGNNFKDILHLYIPFDCMAVNHNKSIQMMDLLERQKAMRILEAFNDMPDKVLGIYIKDFLLIDSPEDVFTSIGELEKKREELPFKTDGYLVTPNNSPYFTDLSRVPLGTRNLKVNPEICKLKPKEELTIDMRRRDNSDGSVSFLVNEVTNIKNSGRTTILPVPFEGSFYNKFNPAEGFKWDNSIMKDSKKGDIIEFKPVYPQEKGGKYYLEPKMIRPYKLNPNKKEIASAVWDDIHRPFDINTLNGNTFDLLRQYHNQTKKDIIRSIEKDAQVIDIGFGRGGDINKYNSFSKFLAIEPDRENIKQFQERKKTIYNWNTIEPKFKLIEMGGEDPRIIGEARKFFGWIDGKPSGKPLVISMMLSLSFFFGEENLYLKLIKNIKALSELSGASSVTFIGMTIDGDSLKKIFDSEGKANLGPAQMVYDKNNTVTISIDGDTIVKDQTEYLVPTEYFISMLNPQQKHIDRCNKETILTKNEKIFTSTFLTFIVTLKESGSNHSKTVPDAKKSIVRYLKPTIIHPIFYVDDNGIKHSIVSNMDDANSIFACIGKVGIKHRTKGYRVKMDGFSVRGIYLKWLMSESEQKDRIEKMYPENPVEDGFKELMSRHANFYVYEPYVDKFDNFEQLYDCLASDTPFNHEFLDIIGYCFDLTISIVNRDNKVIGGISNFRGDLEDQDSCIFYMDETNGSTYSNIATVSDNGTLSYL
jgi:hypothetical protein